MISLNLPKIKPLEAEPLNHANDLKDSQSLSEFILAAATKGESPSYYFYNPLKHELYFQPDDGFSNSQAQLVATNIKSLFPINNKLFSFVG